MSHLHLWALALALCFAFASPSTSLAQPSLIWSQDGRIVHWSSGQARTVAEISGGNQALFFDPANGKAYWTTRDAITNRSLLQRGNLDGSSIESTALFPALPDSLTFTGIDIAFSAETLCWSYYHGQSNTYGVQCSRLDGSSAVTIATGLAGISFWVRIHDQMVYYADNTAIYRSAIANPAPTIITEVATGRNAIDFAIDGGANLLYWSETSSRFKDGSLHRIGLDGTNAETLIEADMLWPVSLALSPQEGRMYWTDFDKDTIEHAKLDGSDRQLLAIDGVSEPTAIVVLDDASNVRAEDEHPQEDYYLAAAYPNPFQSTTTLRFALDRAAYASLKVFDLLGREVATISEGVKQAGEHQVFFDGSALPRGVYIGRLEVVNHIAQTQMLVLVK